ncbi:MAG TPA: hypothetical protein EYH02_01410 [Ignisphaera aggregans]|uniref:Methylenetetrahydrofolate reductase (NAD(P)H) n=1 Tax=Ignisphaera aggregans TaxID=334771 RepID=A0A833DTC0_9CREN|nr:hypothetical protein [Ignisphaera aggregans]
MEILIELVPSRKFLEYAKAVANYVDGFDIPESPMGVPRPSSTVVGAVLKRVLGHDYTVVSHVRLSDINPVALASTVMGAEVAELDGVLLTVGDKPVYGSSVNQLSSEQAAEFLRSIGVRIALGAILSMRYELNAIRSRVEKPFDFFYALRVSIDSIEKLSRVSEIVTGLGKKLYAYAIIATQRNREFIEKELRQPYIELPKLSEFVEHVQDLVNGVIISCPLDREGQIESVKLLHSLQR